MTWLLLSGLALMSTGADSALARAGPGAETWGAVLRATSGSDRERAAFLLSKLPLLDLMEADSACIMNHVLLTAGSESFHHPYFVPEDTLRRFVLWPVTGYRDHLTDWRLGLQASMAPFLEDTPTATAESLLAAIRRHVAVADSGDLFGPPSPPLATYLRGWGTATEVASLEVAALRSLGIAARLAPEASGAEYWDGDRWVVGALPGAEGVTARAGPACTIELVLTLGGRPFLKRESVGISRWQDDRWKELWSPEFPVEMSQSDTSLALHVPPGDYLVTAGIRNARGEPRVWFQPVRIDSADIVVLRQGLDIPFDELARGDLVRGSLDSISVLTFTDSDGRPWAAADVLGAGHLVLVLLDPRSEPSQRVAAGFDGVAGELAAAGAQLCVVAVGEEGAGLTDPEGAVASALGMKQSADGTWKGLPLVLVLSNTGDLLMWRSAYDLTLPHLALQLVLAGQEGPGPK
jgi:hypothetical protein